MYTDVLDSAKLLIVNIHATEFCVSKVIYC